MPKRGHGSDPEWATAKWRTPDAKPEIELVVDAGGDYRLIDRLLVSGSLPAEVHWRKTAPDKLRMPRVDLFVMDERIRLAADWLQGPERDLVVPWDGSDQAFENVSRAISSFAQAAERIRRKRVRDPSVDQALTHAERQLVALHLVGAVDSMLSREGHTANAYHLGGRDNIQRGDNSSIRPNLDVVFAQADRRLPGWRESVRYRSNLKVALRSRLAGATPEQVDYACELLSIFLGGDRAAIRRAWGSDEL